MTGQNCVFKVLWVGWSRPRGPSHRRSRLNKRYNYLCTQDQSHTFAIVATKVDTFERVATAEPGQT